MWMNMLCMSSRACTSIPGAVCGLMVNTVKSLGWELLCIRANTHEEYISKLEIWKAVMENKGLRVNMKKTKFKVSGVGLMSK